MVNNSLRFRSSASAYLNRTGGTPTNGQKFTLSFWLKRGTLTTSSAQWFFTGGAANNVSLIGFPANSDTLAVYQTDSVGQGQVTTAVLRDPSAWYSVVIAVDTTQASNTDRIKIYINNVQQATSVSGTVTQNSTWGLNSANVLNIGRYGSGVNSNYLDGYLAEVNFIDGQALTPNSFGTFNSYGVWQPITYGGSYGTNGFYLPFTNKTSTTTLGYDFSPAGNNWTTNNISLGATVIQSFTSSGTWTAPTGVTSANYLVVAGGAGSSQIGGGGGAGGFLTGALTVVPGTTYTVTVGAGGTGSSANGSNSVFSSVTASGGGYGGGFTGAGGSGGSGGGSGGRGPNAGGSATSGQGNAGGASTGTGQMGGAGGGGAGAAGSNSGSSGSGLNGANGGNGLASSISGSSVTYAGGGGGANDVSGTTSGSGGSGGGGAGGNQANGTNGTANTGGGGGGSGYPASALTSGGSGIVIISYTNPASSTNDSMTDVPTLTSATAANYAVLNPLNYSTGTLSNGNLQWSSSSATGNGCFATMAFDIASSSQYYWEFTLVSGDVVFGIAPTTLAPTNTSRPGSYSYYAGTGNKYSGTSSSAYGSSYTAGNVIGIAVGNGTITFYKNGTSQGTAFTGLTGIFTPAIFEVSGTYTANFGQQPFVYTPPSGFVALNTYNI